MINLPKVEISPGHHLRPGSGHALYPGGMDGAATGRVWLPERSRIDLGDAPTVTVAAFYSKRRRRDRIELHPAVVDLLRAWLRDRPREVLLWPVSGKVPRGRTRKTAKMMRVDLEAARQQWLGEATNEEERDARAASDFLAYRADDGTFADFHANRHSFITAVAMGNSAVAQDLARHGDPRLTASYTHVPKRRTVIEALPAPPKTETNDPVPFTPFLALILP